MTVGPWSDLEQAPAPGGEPTASTVGPWSQLEQAPAPVASTYRLAADGEWKACEIVFL